MWPVSVDTHGNVSAGRIETLFSCALSGQGSWGLQDATWARCRGWVVRWPWKSIGALSVGRFPPQPGPASPLPGAQPGQTPPDFHSSTKGENHTSSAHEASLCFLTWHSQSLFRLSLPQTCFGFGFDRTNSEIMKFHPYILQ